MANATTASMAVAIVAAREQPQQVYRYPHQVDDEEQSAHVTQAGAKAECGTDSGGRRNARSRGYQQI
jgi:hypothetical protein